MVNLEHVKVVLTKTVWSISLFIKYWIWGVFYFAAAAPIPLSLGRVVLPSFLCTHLDLLNNHSPYCLLCLYWMCPVKRGGHYSRAYSTAKSPGEPWLLWLCRSAGFCFRLSPYFCFLLFHFHECIWLLPVDICAVIKRFTMFQPPLLVREPVILRRLPGACLCVVTVHSDGGDTALQGVLIWENSLLLKKAKGCW